MLKDWCTDNKLQSMHQDITKIIEMAALISPSNAKVDRSFSLINLISTPLRKHLSADKSGPLYEDMWISKKFYREWLSTNPIDHRSSFIEQKKELLVFVYSFLFVFHMFEEKKQRYCINFFYFMCINPVPIFSFFSRVLNFQSQGISWNPNAMF